MIFSFTTDGTGYRDTGKTYRSEAVDLQEARRLALENIRAARSSGATVRTVEKGRKWRVTLPPGRLLSGGIFALEDA